MDGNPLPSIPTFDDYLSFLGPITTHADPTADYPKAVEIRQAAASLATLGFIDRESIVHWVSEHPTWGYALGLSVGLSQEKLKNHLNNKFKTSSWAKAAREFPGEFVTFLDENFSLLALLESQRKRDYTFGDILVARASTRLTAAAAGASGRRVEDEIEAIVASLNLPYETRTRFIGRNSQTAPCDIVVPSGQAAEIAVAAKGFDSTGSKLTDAFGEIRTMAEVREPRQFIMAVIDGIGWKNRQADLRKLYALWQKRQIDGMYTLATLDDFKADLENAARLRRLL